MQRIALAIDIGGSKGMVGLVLEDGTLIDQKRFLWNNLCKDALLEQVVDEAKRLLAKNPEIQPDVIGVNIPGLADPIHGVWVEASFSGIRDWAIAADLRMALGLDCYADNDANAAALAEYCYGNARGLTDFLYLTVSNGIGGAAFVGGKILRGSNNYSMEIGHCTIVENGRLCGCGKNGCLEMYASGRGIALNYASLGENQSNNGTLVQSQEIKSRALAGDELALKTFELEGKYLGFAIATACNMFNPQRVIIGGGVSLAFKLFKESLYKTFEKNLYSKANPNVDIIPTALGYNGALLGAAATGFAGLSH